MPCWSEGSIKARAALSSDLDGQRMAALPCALAVEALLGGGGAREATGALAAYDLLGAEALLARIEREGFAWTRAARAPAPAEARPA